MYFVTSSAPLKAHMPMGRYAESNLPYALPSSSYIHTTICGNNEVTVHVNYCFVNITQPECCQCKN